MKPIIAITAACLALAACSSTQSYAPASIASAAASHSIQGTETATGTFVGASDHATSGHASVFRSDGKWYISLANDFSFDGAPDPKIAFGADGFRQDAILTRLTSNTGASVYEVPAALDVGDYNEIWLWCEQFGVPLGVAKLTLK